MNDNGNEPDTLLADLLASFALRLRPRETVREALDRAGGARPAARGPCGCHRGVRGDDKRLEECDHVKNARPIGPPSASSRMRIANLIRGKQSAPLRLIVYGVEGVGKSTFAAGAPAPIFLCAESGTHHLDVARFPTPTTWVEVLEAIDSLMFEEHDRKTLVIDTIDWLEPLCWAQVAHDQDVPSVDAIPYNGGYTVAVAVWRQFLERLEKLREVTGMHVVILAHSTVKTFKNPDSATGDFDRYELKLHHKASGVWKEWCDALFFATFETSTKKLDGRMKGVSTGRRVAMAERTAAFDAKNRYGLPTKFPLSWQAFSDAARAARAADAKDQNGAAPAPVEEQSE